MPIDYCLDISFHCTSKFTYDEQMVQSDNMLLLKFQISQGIYNAHELFVIQITFAGISLNL